MKEAALEEQRKLEEQVALETPAKDAAPTPIDYKYEKAPPKQNEKGLPSPQHVEEIFTRKPFFFLLKISVHTLKPTRMTTLPN